ncbi:TniB family NTP-binding protein [Plantactinospora sp. WMMB334]|uniref:TniB family NTP-binding protein n=1 Tax=Plantactinospora sp. WMMB334 TaxID=3404119 RepID=UPI003B95496D
MTAILPRPRTGEPDDAEPSVENPLTTKEGWRRFVDTEPNPPALLTEAALAGLSAGRRVGYDEARMEYHADLPLVNTPVIRQVIATSRLLIQLNRNQVSARRGVIISGASGTGKTTALSQLGRAHELAARRRHPQDRHRLPVVYITVPPAATPRMVAVEFARFFGLPAPRSANLTDVTNAVCATAARTHVDLVLVDEIHNISLATRAGAEVSDTLKYFAERLPATFIYAGLDVDEIGLFAGTRGRQIAGRFTLIPARPFDYGTSEQRETWRGLVSTMEASLRLHRHQPGTFTGLDEYLFARTSGMIGSLSHLVRGAAVLAIQDGTEQITKDLLDLIPVDHAAQRAHVQRPGRRGKAKK